MKHEIYLGRKKHREIHGQSRGIQLQAFIERIENGWTMEEAIQKPNRRGGPKYKHFRIYPIKCEQPND